MKRKVCSSKIYDFEVELHQLANVCTERRMWMSFLCLWEKFLVAVQFQTSVAHWQFQLSNTIQISELTRYSQSSFSTFSQIEISLSLSSSFSKFHTYFQNNPTAQHWTNIFLNFSYCFSKCFFFVSRHFIFLCLQTF